MADRMRQATRKESHGVVGVGVVSPLGHGTQNSGLKCGVFTGFVGMVVVGGGGANVGACCRCGTGTQHR